MKKIFILLVSAIAFVGLGSASAQSRNSYFMEGSYFRNDLNPALAPTRGYVALPGISGFGLNVTNNFLSIDNFIYQRDGQLVTALHDSVSSEEFFGKLPSEGKFAIDTKVNLFGVGFYAKKMYWTFGVNANVSADMAMSMDMFKAIKTLGNGVYDLGNTAIEANAYMDAYLGTSFRVHDNVSIGVKVKFLMGIATLDAQFSELMANVSPDVVTAEMNGAWRANGIFLSNRGLTGNDFDLEDAFITDPQTMLNNIENYGLAFDLGAEVRLLDDQLKLSAAITDLGFIKWRPNSHLSGGVTGDFSFAGVNIEDPEMDALGSFEMSVNDKSENSGYKTSVNTSLNIGAEYNILNNHIAFGVLSHTKFCRTMTYSELIASVNLRPTNWLSATVSHTFMNNNRPGIFGLALNIHPRVINIYAGLDFIDTNWINGPTIEGMQIPLPRYMKSMNAYIGIGFNFARPKFVRDAKKYEF